MNSNAPSPHDPTAKGSDSSDSSDSSHNPHSSASRPATAQQIRNPLHGVTLESMVVGLHAYFGWEELGRQIPVRCFQSDPSVASSLKFLRKTPWAREKVESLYLFMLRDKRRHEQDVIRDGKLP